MSDAAPAPAPVAKPGLLGKPVVLVGVLVAVMAAEFAVLWVLLPGPPPDPDAAARAAVEEAPDAVEKEIDTFSTTNGRAAPGSVIHVTFKLTALVPTAQATEFDTAANQVHKARVRQAVFKVARSATLDDLNDPNLATMRRQLREEINKVLRKSYLTDVVISDFKTLEQ